MIEHPVVERWGTSLLLLVVFATRAWHADQPPLEGYVGRQIPTAMVARNLARGSGFFHPQLDTGPFPNLFLVEPPIMAGVVATISRLTGSPLDPTGRLVSAGSMTLAAWGIAGLVRRRSGLTASLGAVVALASFPISIRFGRAFQPDAMALGLVVASARLIEGSGRWWRAIGWGLLAIGLAQKVSYVLVLLPIVGVLLAGRPRSVRWGAVLVLVPASLWYLGVAVRLAGEPVGVAASADNAANWLARLAPTAYLDGSRWSIVGRDLLIRAFNPIASSVAVLGLAATWRDPSVRIWRLWGLGSAMALVVLFGKLHHQYYWLIMAAPIAAWAGLGIARIGEHSRPLAYAALGLLFGLGLLPPRGTWDTPEEWRGAVALAGEIDRVVPEGDRLVAAEAVIYLSDRKGCRLEYEGPACRRAANEWRPADRFEGVEPADLVAFYRSFARARWFADLEPGPTDRARRDLHRAVLAMPGARRVASGPGFGLIVRFDDLPPL